MNVSGRESVRFTANVSTRGLYVLGPLPSRPGADVEMDVDLPGFGMVTMRARLVWGRRVPRGLESVTRSGFGLEVVEAGPAWYAWCRDLEARSGGAQPPPLPSRLSRSSAGPARERAAGVQSSRAAQPRGGAAEAPTAGVPVASTRGPSRRPGERLFPRAPVPGNGRPAPGLPMGRKPPG